MAEQADWHADVRGRARARVALQPASRSRWMVVLAALIGLHVLIFWRWYQSYFPIAVVDSTILEVRLLDEPAPLPRAPEPIAPSRQAPRMAATMLPAAPPRSAAPAIAVPSAPAPQLFDQNGAVRLPAEARFVTPHDTGVAHGKELLARGHNMIHCKRSKFDDSPTPEEAANQAVKGARMAHLVTGNPLDPLNDVGAEDQAEDAGERAAEKRTIEERTCDY